MQYPSKFRPCCKNFQTIAIPYLDESLNSEAQLRLIASLLLATGPDSLLESAQMHELGYALEKFLDNQAHLQRRFLGRICPDISRTKKDLHSRCEGSRAL